MLAGANRRKRGAEMGGSNMKRPLLGALAIALLLATSARAETLSNEEERYIAISVGTYVAGMVCDAKVIKNSLRLIADKTGVETRKFDPAILAAMQAQMDSKYERDDLIPAVTREVAGDLKTIDADMGKSKQDTCTRLIKLLREGKTIE